MSAVSVNNSPYLSKYEFTYSSVVLILDGLGRFHSEAVVEL
jgi:hypothetical protein